MDTAKLWNPYASLKTESYNLRNAQVQGLENLIKTNNISIVSLDWVQTGMILVWTGLVRTGLSTNQLESIQPTSLFL